MDYQKKDFQKTPPPPKKKKLLATIYYYFTTNNYCPKLDVTDSVEEFPSICIFQEDVMEAPTRTLTKEPDHMIMTQHLHDTDLKKYHR